MRLKNSHIVTKYYKFGAIQFNIMNPNSRPMKHAALAGKARTITGVIPLNNAGTPSSAINFLKTSLNPLGYVPSGATKELE